MIRLTTFADQRIAVFGLGGSGLASAAALRAGGAHPVCYDDNAAGRAAAATAGYDVQDLRACDWSEIGALVLAPGVPLTHPEPHWTVKLAQQHSTEIIGDVELFLRQRQSWRAEMQQGENPTAGPAGATGPTLAAPVIAVTGTNGKSTTTALLAHLLREMGCDVQMGGNIGVPVLALEPFQAGRVYVLELSSYQIDLTPSLNEPSVSTGQPQGDALPTTSHPAAPEVGILLNITPDHLDRHGTFANYAAVKQRLVEASRVACIGVDDDTTKAIARDLSQTGQPLLAFTAGKSAAVTPDIYAIGSSVFLHEQTNHHASSTQVADLALHPALRGRHNLQNAMAAIAAMKALDLVGPAEVRQKAWQPDRLPSALQSFGGLAHRLETVGYVGQILFVNDSKATNAEASEKALTSFPGGIHWIVGGVAKTGGIDALLPLMPRVARAYLIGEAAEPFAQALAGHTAIEVCGTLDAAIMAATQQAQAEHAATPNANARDTQSAPVILLSPACASFDQYRNFEVRGLAFKDCASALPGFVPIKPAGEQR
ncbi:MAG: UDP-N-acetylmuramoyl-L-alanine--D-glutamate ligase [Pseudomonadota bacterium]